MRRFLRNRHRCCGCGANHMLRRGGRAEQVPAGHVQSMGRRDCAWTWHPGLAHPLRCWGGRKNGTASCESGRDLSDGGGLAGLGRDAAEVGLDGMAVVAWRALLGQLVSGRYASVTPGAGRIHRVCAGGTRLRRGAFRTRCHGCRVFLTPRAWRRIAVGLACIDDGRKAAAGGGTDVVLIASIGNGGVR